MNADQIEDVLAMRRHESGALSASERRYEAFVKAVAAKLGHSIDGDQHVDGYSLDFAFSMFEDDFTVAEAVEEFRAWIAEIATNLTK